MILGKTNMDEFAMGSSNEHSAYGPIVQPVGPRDACRAAVSGGSAVAVAAYHAPALARDRHRRLDPPAGGADRDRRAEADVRPGVAATGSSRSPSSLDQIGPFARDVRDAAALLHAVAGRDERDSTSAPVPVPDELLHLPDGDDEAAAGLRGKRLGLPREYFVAGMEPGRRGAGSRRRSRRSRPPARPSRRSACRTRTTASRRTTSSRRPRRRPTSPATTGSGSGRGSATATCSATTSRRAAAASAPEVKRRIMLGTYALSAGYYDAYYVKAQKVRTLIKRDFDALFEQGFDALVAPTSPTVAFRFGAKMADPVAMYLSDACTLPVNMAGLPGISIPCGLSEGLPVGLQLIGAGLVRAGAVPAVARLRGDHRRRRRGATRSRPQLGLTDGSVPAGARGARGRACGRRPLTARPDPVGYSDPAVTTSPSPTRAPLAERALAERVLAVPPSGIRRFFDILATMDDVISLGRGRARLRHARADRRGRRRESLHDGPDALHVATTARSSSAGRSPPISSAATASRYDPATELLDHGRRVRGGRPRPAGDLRSRATR